MPSYKEDLLNDLRSKPGYAAKYLTAAAADSDEAFLVALRDIAQARIGMTRLATAARVNRVNLYGMLSKRGNPGIRNILAILGVLKLKIDIVDELRAPSTKPPQAAVLIAARESEMLGRTQDLKETLGSSSAPENYSVGHQMFRTTLP